MSPTIETRRLFQIENRKSDAGPAGLPCLNSNNSIDTENGTETAPLHSSHVAKLAFALEANVKKFIDMVGIEFAGFLTLTFPDNLTDHKEAQRRFNSFRTNFFSKHFGQYMLVKERQKRGAWHYHMLTECLKNIRKGFNWDQIRRGNYKSANPYLRGLWKLLRENMPKYGFGRAELMPVKTNKEGIARYVAKYIKKHFEGRKKEDKGVRLVQYSRRWPRTSCKFSWNTEGAKKWRRKLAKFALLCCRVGQIEDMLLELGPHWAFHHRERIRDIDFWLPTPVLHKVICAEDVQNLSFRQQYFNIVGRCQHMSNVTKEYICKLYQDPSFIEFITAK